MGEFFESKLEFKDCDYVEFSKLNQDKVIGTDASLKEKATVWDIESKKIVREFSPQFSNNYARNQATFDPSDELVLTDGVLYDMRMSKEVRKLDKLNQSLNGVFHPNGLEIISSSEIWDIRTFHLLKTVKGLDNCSATFTNSGDIIYAVGLEQDSMEDEETYDSSFKTFDASDYSLIATIETKRAVLGLCPSSNDQQLAVVENPLDSSTSEESAVRLYDVGRHKAEDEDMDDEDNDDDEDVEDEEEDGVGFDSDVDGSEDEVLDDDGVSSDEDDDDDDEDLDGAGEGELLDMIANMARAQGRREARRTRQAQQAARQQQDDIQQQLNQQLQDIQQQVQEQQEVELAVGGADEPMEDEGGPNNEDDEWEDIEEEVVLDDET